MRKLSFPVKLEVPWRWTKHVIYPSYQAPPRCAVVVMSREHGVLGQSWLNRPDWEETTSQKKPKSYDNRIIDRRLVATEGTPFYSPIVILPPTGAIHHQKEYYKN